MLDLLQWPAMAATLLAAWLVGSQRKGRRELGFWVFIASNVLWIAWGWHDEERLRTGNPHRVVRTPADLRALFME